MHRKQQHCQPHVQEMTAGDAIRTTPAGGDTSVTQAPGFNFGVFSIASFSFANIVVVEESGAEATAQSPQPEPEMCRARLSWEFPDVECPDFCLQGLIRSCVAK